MSAEDQWRRPIADPVTPDRVKAVLDLVARLDPVDAANGLEVTADLAARRAGEVLAAGLAVGMRMNGYRSSQGSFCEHNNQP